MITPTKQKEYLKTAGTPEESSLSRSLFELAVDDSENKQNQNRNNGNGYNPICSHPVSRSSVKHLPKYAATGIRDDLPTRHPSQCLHTPIDVSFTLQQNIPCMLNRLSLPMQIRQRTRTDSLCLIR